MGDPIDDLYSVDPAEFVERRNALAKQLKAEGDRDAAATVSKLRRPTVVAWALNQLARLNPTGIEELIAAGDELSAAQRRALSAKGKGADALRAAAAQRRDVVKKLVTEAAGLLPGGAANAAQQEALTASLEAASVDPDAAAALQEGHLEKEIEAPSGFGELGGLTLVPDAEPEADPAAEEEGRKAEEAERQRKYEEAVDKADREVDKAEAEVARLEEQLERSRQKAEEAKKRRAELEEPSRP
jgi:hypothetical protein